MVKMRLDELEKTLNTWRRSTGYTLTSTRYMARLVSLWSESVELFVRTEVKLLP